MENGYRKSLNIRFHLDPRTKLLLLILFSVVVMIDVTDGPAYIVRAIMTYIPVVLVCLEGKPHVGARFTVLFILATWLMEITQENSRGTKRYSIIFVTLPPPKAIPLIRIASRIDRYSSDNVGKKRIITAIEIASPCGRRIRFIAAINSLIFVVEIQYQTIIIVGANCVIM